MDVRNEFDQPAEPVGPETDDTVNPTEAEPGEGDRPRAAYGREMLVQLQQMIDTLATQAGPVMRDVAAKSAELAAIAAEKAGPLAHKAADATDSFSQRMAARSKELAAEWRRAPGEGEQQPSMGVAPDEEADSSSEAND